MGTLFQRRRKIFIALVIATIVAVQVFVICNLFLQMDFSQDYRAIAGVENIIFQSNASRDTFYKRCFWGLKKTDVPAFYEPHNVIVPDWRLEEMEGSIGDNRRIVQSVLSPDGNYILYCEIEYGYTDSGLTDDEYCRYKVYNVETEEVTELYGAYREWYNLYWEEK